MPGVPTNLSRLHAQMITWFMKHQPTSRQPHKGFFKMRSAESIEASEYVDMRSTSPNGLSLFMTGLSWLYLPNCHHPAKGPSREQLLMEVTEVFKVMHKL